MFSLAENSSMPPVYTVEGGGAFWNMVEHCGMFQYHMHSIAQPALLP